MKYICGAALMLAVLLSLGIFSACQISSISREVSSAVAGGVDAARRNDFESASALFTVAKEAWHSHDFYLSSCLVHAEKDAIALTLVRCQSASETEDYESLHAEAQALLELVENIKALEGFSVKNIV